jgi:alginate O-acetyltransferase complex protein AlgI
MLFNSLEFSLFLPVVFLLYWLVRPKGYYYQNIILLLASYFFYGWWDWRFLALIAFSTVIDFFIARQLASSEKNRKFYLFLSIAVNIGLLGVFKYYNFFIDNFNEAFSLFGSDIEIGTLDIILPIGISFYTFQTLSYTIDVYRRHLAPTNDLLAFAVFVGFFPQLVAGPIERAKNLLPQFQVLRSFDYTSAVNGLRQILWGLVKKIIIADNCALFANQLFDAEGDFSGSALLLGAIFFAFQIYGDFSGYSDIAIGTARLFGINLKQNFAFPYFSRDIAEFWRRWHISLTSWFRDYVFIPLGGSKGKLQSTILNVCIVFLVSGLWHGANWTFIAWGLLNALYYVPLLLLKKNRIHTDVVASERVFPTVKEIAMMSMTFILTVFAWIFFRSETLHQAWLHSAKILSPSLFTIPEFMDKQKALVTMLLIVLFISIEWKGRKEKYAIEKIGLSWHYSVRYAFYALLIASLFWFGGVQQPFIYFQF